MMYRLSLEAEATTLSEAWDIFSSTEIPRDFNPSTPQPFTFFRLEEVDTGKFVQFGGLS